jgi:acetolactate synthase-1/2/3 large subunit
VVDVVVGLLRGDGPVTLLVGGTAVRERGLRAVARVAGATGASVLCETFPPNLARGGGLPRVEQLNYLAEFAQLQLEGCRHLVLVDAAAPVSFFAYPGKAGDLVPPGCTVHVLAGPGEDAPDALETLAEAVGAPTAVPSGPEGRPERPQGPLTAASLGDAVGALLPEGAVVVDEALTSGIFVAGATAGGPRHDWLSLTGGAIGQGLPAATGAALGAPGRRVLSLQADGSALYTVQALWTQAREQLDVTTLLLANRSYAILQMELERVGADGGGPAARSMLSLDRPELDFVALAGGFGVPATRAATADELVSQLAAALATPGPSLVEALLVPGDAL